jgi:hypothetical protein
LQRALDDASHDAGAYAEGTWTLQESEAIETALTQLVNRSVGEQATGATGKLTPEALADAASALGSPAVVVSGAFALPVGATQGTGEVRDQLQDAPETGEK